MVQIVIFDGAKSNTRLPVVSTEDEQLNWPNYLCSESGRVFGLVHMHFLVPMLKAGRRAYKLSKIKDNRSSTSVAIISDLIVAAAFHPSEANPSWHVHHVNGNRIDDRPSNVVWMSPEAHWKLHPRQQPVFFQSHADTLG